MSQAIPPPLEYDLRNMLVRNLELIEPGLRPVQFEERPLPNAHGTSGSVDILARDRHQMWVVIELKRSRSSSRHALHEVTKYTELLRREMHIAADRIRAVIVAMPEDWAELLTPVSNAARDWNHDLRGYRLLLDSNGQLDTAERVQLLPKVFEHRVTPIHTLFFFTSEEQRLHGWQTIRQCAEELGADDLLAAEFDRVAQTHVTPAPFGLYLAIGRINYARASEGLLGGYDGPEPFATEYPAEYLALSGICNHVARQNLLGMGIEGAEPGLLRTLADSPDWTVRRYLGAGSFDTSAFEERDLFRFLSGDARGDSQVIYTGSASPQVVGRWNAFLQETQSSLVGNPEWEQLVGGWLEDAAERAEEGDVWLNIYNPCDLMQAIVFGWPAKLNDHLPMVMGGTKPQRASGSYVRGALCWTGRGIALTEAVQLVHRDPIHWAINRSSGLGWMHDQELLNLIGLHYVLLEQIGPYAVKGSTANDHRIWHLRGDTLHVCSLRRQPQEYASAYEEIAAGGELVSVAEYLRAQAHEVDALTSAYRAHLDIA